MNNKHYLIFFCKSAGTYVVTEPLPWSRHNQHHFPQFDFVNTKPRTEDINLWLEENRNFIRHEYIGIVVLINLDPNVNL